MKTLKPITTKSKLTMKKTKDKDNQFNAKTNDIQKVQSFYLSIILSYFLS